MLEAFAKSFLRSPPAVARKYRVSPSFTHPALSTVRYIEALFKPSPITYSAEVTASAEVSSLTQIYLIALAIASVAVYLMYVNDKRYAVTKAWRTRERHLLWGTLASPVGAFFGMVIPWHKVRKRKFWTTLVGSIGLHVFVLLKTMKRI
ncbi:hypothetical protein M8J77_010375 [Diaphorina citri]|jgi:Predicted membrane protein|nr:hypothetical protein M8J77_010375 [Diaphorina citri]